MDQCLDSKVGTYQSGDGDVKRVYLADGSHIDADLVVTAVGGKPNTWFLKNMTLDKDGGVNSDVFLRSSNPDVFAAGDIVSYPYFYTNERIRVEHLSEAYSQGSHAAWNMLGKMIPYQNVPFYWSRQWNKSVACVGVPRDWDSIVIDGDKSKYEFAAYYFKNGKVIAAAGMARSKDLITVSHAMKSGFSLTADHFNGTKLDIEKVRKALHDTESKCACKRAKSNQAPCRD